MNNSSSSSTSLSLDMCDALWKFFETGRGLSELELVSSNSKHQFNRSVLEASESECKRRLFRILREIAHTPNSHTMLANLLNEHFSDYLVNDKPREAARILFQAAAVVEVSENYDYEEENAEPSVCHGDVIAIYNSPSSKSIHKDIFGERVENAVTYRDSTGRSRRIMDTIKNTDWGQIDILLI